ncbi:MAG: SBBP repeat-containing protein, partial [Bacteroidota bacterium]
MRSLFKTILFVFTGFIFPLLSLAQDFQWAKTMGSGSIDAALSVKTDPAGNVYSTGVFSDSADFDPGPGVFKLTSAGAEDVFISRLDASGNFMWAKAIGGMFSDYGTSLAIDISGNIYITGHFLGTVDFDPGLGTFNLTSVGSINTFVCKLDAQGNFVWAKSMGGSFQNSANAISLDAGGNIYLAGSFFETVDFDPGAGIFNLTSVGGQDIYISKLDASGNFKWAKAMGGPSDDFPVSIAPDPSGNILTTGAFNETADFDPGSGVFSLTSKGAEDIFISNIDSSGQFVWAKSMGSESFDEGQAITTDASGNVFVTGFFSFTVDFDPGTGVFNLSTPGDKHDYDIYILKLNNSGTFSWAKSIYA